MILFAIGFHEFSHAKFADMAGDPTPRAMGRVTMNPFAHLDPVGTIMIIITSITGFGIGWGKPVLVQPHRMKNPRWDHFVSVLAGPVSNLVQAVVFAMVLRIMLQTGTQLHPLGEQFLLMGLQINLALFVFNLFPLGPLDGHWLIGTFMPEPMRLAWYRFNRGLGAILFLILVLVPSGSPFDILGRVLYPAVRFLAQILLGERL